MVSRGTYAASWEPPSPTTQNRATNWSFRGGAKTDNNGSEKGVKKNTNWRPFVISRTFLLGFTFLSILFIILIEALLQYSNKHAGLVFGSVEGENGEPASLSMGDTFGFQYFPTLVAVIYGLLWTWVDHDVKRLEPYFQMSKPGGALARDSLLLNYPYSLVATVPVVAFRRRHWAVFYSGSILVLIFFALTPLFSAVFATDIVDRAVLVSPVSTSTVIPLELQNSSLSASFTFLAYDHTYMNASLPPFTTAEFAVLPFQLTDGSSPLKANETWTGMSTRLSADLNCTQAKVERFQMEEWTEDYPGNFWFTDESKNCAYNLTYKSLTGNTLLAFSSDWNTWFTSHGKNLRFAPPVGMSDDYALNYEDCPNEHAFMAMWGKKYQFPNQTEAEQGLLQKWFSDDWTALFCEPVYESQPVEVTVQASTGAILRVTEKGEKVKFEGLNATYFEDLMSIGVNAASTKALDVATIINAEDEYPFAPPDHKFQLRKRFSETINIYNTHSLTGFGLAEETDLASLLDPANLGEMFARPYRLLFAIAVASELSTVEPSTVQNLTYTQTYQVQAIVVDNIFARLIEAGMILLVLFAIGLIVTTWNRDCNLAHDPSSIASGMTTISGSPAVIADMQNFEWMGEDKLVTSLRKSGHRYYLASLPTGGHRLNKLNPTIYKTQEEADQEKALLETSAKSIESMALDSNSTHWELHPVMGLFVCAMFLAMVVFLGYLYSAAKKWGGLPHFGNTFQNNLLYNYLPTFIATFIEPFWVLITRYTALVMPYQELRKGNTSPAKTLAVNYDSKPPHFVTYRSFRSRHFLLSALSVMSLSANLLAVSFGGLFQDSTTQWLEETNFIQSLSPVMKPSNVSLDITWSGSSSSVQLDNPNYNISGSDLRQPELFYVAYANASHNLNLPQWTSSEYFFLPFTSDDPDLQGKPRQGETRGYGVDVVCKEHPKDQAMMIQKPKSDSGNGGPGNDYQLALWQPCRSDGDGVGTYSVDMYTSLNFDIATGLRELPLTEGLGYVDFMGTFRYSKQCPGRFLAGWIQSKVVLIDDDDMEVLGVTEEPEFVAINCEVQFQTALFSVRVDQNNTVLGYERIGDFDNSDDFFINTTASQFVSLFSQTMSDDANLVNVGVEGGAVSRYVRNDPRPYDWVNYLMRNLPDTDRPGNIFPPDPQVAGRALEKVYKSIFAIFLERYSDGLFSVNRGTFVVGHVRMSEARTAMSQVMFIISIIILSGFIIIGTITYIIRPGYFLSNLPTSLAIEMSTYYASNAIEDVAGTEAMQPDERSRLLKRLGNKYGYGVYVGRDGKQHFGIDREPLVGRGSKAKMQARQVRISEGFSTGSVSRLSGIAESGEETNEQRGGLLRAWDREHSGIV